MKHQNHVLDDTEEVLWEGSPNFLAFFISSLIPAAFGVPFFLIGAFFAVIGVMAGQWYFIFMPHMWIGAGLVFGIPLYRILVHKHTRYTITDKRVILKTGVIGRDYNIIDFDQISNASVNVGLIDKVFAKNSGTIYLHSAGIMPYMGNMNKGSFGIKPYALVHIDNPYDVFSWFKKLSHDVKTDVNYPNAYRPKKNPGYRTKVRNKVKTKKRTESKSSKKPPLTRKRRISKKKSRR